MKHSKKRIAIDNDDVLFPFVETFFRYYNTRYKTKHHISHQLGYKLAKTLMLSEEQTMEVVFDFYKSKDILTMNPIAGSIEALKRLKIKYDLVLITARPIVTTEITTTAINQFFPDIFQEIHLTNSFAKADNQLTKAKLCREMDISLLVDDSPTNVIECVQAGIPMILFRRPWNVSLLTNELLLKQVFTADNWPQVVQIVESNLPEK